MVCVVDITLWNRRVAEVWLHSECIPDCQVLTTQSYDGANIDGMDNGSCTRTCNLSQGRSSHLFWILTEKSQLSQKDIRACSGSTKMHERTFARGRRAQIEFFLLVWTFIKNKFFLTFYMTPTQFKKHLNGFKTVIGKSRHYGKLRSSLKRIKKEVHCRCLLNLNCA